MSTIAIIDDDDDLRDTMCTLLEAAGYQTEAFSEGREALAGIARGPRPDLILLDLMMPGMNGWQFRDAQLGDGPLAEIPVVVMSARSSIVAPGVPSLGEVDVLRKPFAIDELLSVIARHVPPSE